VDFAIHANPWDRIKNCFCRGRGNIKLIDRIIAESPEATQARDKLPYYGKNIFLDAARFPFENEQLIEKVAHFLAS
jgi:hypothetical protein